MFNPWKWLPEKEPYIHPEDVKDLERLYGSKPKDQRPQTEILPSPVVGDPLEASVLLLSKYPVYSAEEIEEYKTIDGYFDACRKSLTFENRDCPFFYLDPRFAEAEAAKWWQPKLAQLVEDCGVDAVAHRVATVTYFPYHVEAWTDPGELVYTQRHFCRDIARRALHAGKLVVLVNFAKEWKRELGFPNAITLKAPQNAALTPGNIAGDRYKEVVAAVKGPVAVEA